MMMGELSVCCFSMRRRAMPFYQGDDYPAGVRVDDDIERLWRNFKALEEKFDKLDKVIGYLMLSVGEILKKWENDERKETKDTPSV
jgi:hypothetical protein